MNIRVGIGILSLIASISLLQGRASASSDAAATNVQQQASTGATIATIGADVSNILNTANNLVEHHDKPNIVAGVGQLLSSIFSIVSTALTLAHKNDVQPMVIEMREAVVNNLVNAIDCSREYLKHVSLSELGCALKDAEKEVAMCAARVQDVHLAQEENVKNVLKAFVHDLFALIQNSGTNDNIGESIAQMLTNIIELATDTIKYEQLAADDMDTCAAMYVDRVCAELTRQIRHLMVQSALTLRGSPCSVECCKNNSSRPCAAAIAMMTGTRKGCNSCCRPSARPCCSSCCNNSQNNCCCFKRAMPMDDEMEMRKSCNCGCKPNNCTCKPNCNSCRPNCGCSMMDMGMDMDRMEMRKSCNCGCKPNNCTCKPNCTSCRPNCGCSMMDMSTDMDRMEMRKSCNCGCKPNCNSCKPNCGCSMMDMDMDDARMCKCGCGCGSDRMMDCTMEMMACEGMETRSCPCNKPQPQPRPVAAQARIMAEQKMDPMATAKRIIIKCPCTQPSRPTFQNSPRPPAAPQQQQISPSRKDGNRVLPEGHDQSRCK